MWWEEDVLLSLPEMTALEDAAAKYNTLVGNARAREAEKYYERPWKKEKQVNGAMAQLSNFVLGKSGWIAADVGRRAQDVGDPAF